MAKVNRAAAFNPGQVIVVAYTGTPGQSAAITGNVVRLVATAACHVKFGTNPTATTSDIYLPANVPEYFYFPTGSKISAIQVSSGGNLHICIGQ